MKHTNSIARGSKSLIYISLETFATQLDPNQPSQCFTASPVRARERQIRAPKKGVLVFGVRTRVPYPAHVTVYPYNAHITGTNPIVRHVMSLTWTLKRMRANQRAPKHAATQPSRDLWCIQVGDRVAVFG